MVEAEQGVAPGGALGANEKHTTQNSVGDPVATAVASAIRLSFAETKNLKQRN